jgi:hypothetical protein
MSASSNPYFSPTPPTKAQEALTQQIEQLNQSAHSHNTAKANEKVVLGPLKRYCSLCSSELVKSKKTEKLEDLGIEVPKWKCKLCFQYYVGIGKELYTPNHKVKAIVFELSEVI